MHDLKLRIIAASLILVGSAASATQAQTPQLTSVTPDSGPTIGGASLQIAGLNFGATEGSGGVTVGGAACTGAIWSATLVECTLPPGQGAGQPVQLTTDGGLTSGTLPFDYDAPILTGVDPASGPAAGGDTLTLTGSNFGQTGSVTVGGLPCAIITYGQSSVTCTAPAGTGTQPVVISVSGQASGSQPYEYIPAPPPVPALSWPGQMVLVVLLGLSVVLWSGTLRRREGLVLQRRVSRSGGRDRG